MSCPHGIDRELVDCAQCEREEKLAHARRVYDHQQRVAANLMAQRADFDRGARAFFDFLRSADVARCPMHHFRACGRCPNCGEELPSRKERA